MPLSPTYNVPLSTPFPSKSSSDIWPEVRRRAGKIAAGLRRVGAASGWSVVAVELRTISFEGGMAPRRDVQRTRLPSGKRSSVAARTNSISTLRMLNFQGQKTLPDVAAMFPSEPLPKCTAMPFVGMKVMMEIRNGAGPIHVSHCMPAGRLGGRRALRLHCAVSPAMGFGDVADDAAQINSQRRR